MTREEVRALLLLIREFDGRNVDDSTVFAWESLLELLDFHLAAQAVREHFEQSTAYLMPAHIVQRVKELREQSIARGRQALAAGKEAERTSEKPPYFDAMVTAAEEATHVAVAAGWGHGDKVTRDSALAAAREVEEAWKVAHP